jgi:glycosyltransferase involved in cell wall biosynthesis
MSKVEGFFGPPMEAMACGCAVIVGKVTGFDEYIMDGKNALVVEEGDVAAARSAVQQLISDRNLRQKLIDGGYETVKKWSWDKSTNMLQKVIKNEPVEVFYTDCFPERYEFKRNEDLAVLAR